MPDVGDESTPWAEVRWPGSWAADQEAGWRAGLRAGGLGLGSALCLMCPFDPALETLEPFCTQALQFWKPASQPPMNIPAIAGQHLL